MTDIVSIFALVVFALVGLVAIVGALFRGSPRDGEEIPPKHDPATWRPSTRYEKEQALRKRKVLERLAGRGRK